jgi:DNA-binding NarL/FixJ family response regulator
LDDVVKILLIDDHQLFIDGLTSVLKSCLPSAQITQINSPIAALECLIERQSFDLTLLDFCMPEMNGLSFLNALHDHSIIVPVAVVSATEDANDIKAVLDSGAIGFISKSSSSDELMKAVHSILEGNIYVPEWYETNMPSITDDKSSVIHIAKQLGITARQLQVLELLAKGHSNGKIAEILFLNEETVKSHIAALLRTFGAENRTKCINAARRRGLINDSI